MESSKTDTKFKSPGDEYPPSRPGISFALCVAAAAIGLIAYLVFY